MVKYINECHDMGIMVWPPDGRAIRFGLGAAKNPGQAAVEAIDKARAQRDRESGQVGLFGEMMAAEEHHGELPNVPEWTDKEKLAGEKELLGFWVTGHPLDRYAEKVAELTTRDSSSLDGLAKNADVALCGVLTGVTRKRNKEGKPWATMTIEDRSGSIEALVFATAYERLAPQIVEDEAVFIRGLALPEDGGATKISVQDIVTLENARVDLPSAISIRVWLGRNGKTARSGRRRWRNYSAGNRATRRCACAWKRRGILRC